MDETKQKQNLFLSFFFGSVRRTLHWTNVKFSLEFRQEGYF